MTPSSDIRKQLAGYGLTTIEVHYYMPDHPALLQMFAFQQYDLAPRFPRLGGFLGIAAIHPQAARLVHRDAGGQRRLLDRTGSQLQPAPGRTIGLRQHQGNRMAGRQDGLQRKAGKIGRTGKSNAHRVNHP